MGCYSLRSQKGGQLFERLGQCRVGVVDRMDLEEKGSSRENEAGISFFIYTAC